MNDSDDFDYELLRSHTEQAARNLPGPDYYTVLHWIHEILRPHVYVEIGVRQGRSLQAALATTECIAIDPDPLLPEPIPSNVRLFRMTSDEFFASSEPSRTPRLATFSLAFIDGLHLFEQALRDFIHLEKLASKTSVILLHDCLPLDEATSARQRSTHFYSGDVWKLPMCLKTFRPDLSIVTVKTPPTGLALVANLDPRSELLATSYDRCIAAHMRLSFKYYKDHLEQMPATIDNSLESLVSYLSTLTIAPRSSAGPSNNSS